MGNDGLAWRLDDVAAYDVMQNRSHVLIALLLTLTEVADVRAALREIDPGDRHAVDDLSEALRRRIQKLGS